MGHGASQISSPNVEEEELRVIFSAFKACPRGGDDLTQVEFEALYALHAPSLRRRARDLGRRGSSGNLHGHSHHDETAVHEAAKELRLQLSKARDTLKERRNSSARGLPGLCDEEVEREKAAVAIRERATAARLRGTYPWAADLATNTRAGLAAGMLTAHALRLVRLEVCGAHVVALLDSGAQRSAMSLAAAKRCGLAELIDASFSRGVAGGDGLVTGPSSRGSGFAGPSAGSGVARLSRGHGRVHFCEISIADVTFEHALDVIEWPPSAVDFEAILGLDLLARGDATIDLQQHALYLSNRTGQRARAPLLPERAEDPAQSEEAAEAVRELEIIELSNSFRKT